MGLPAYMNSTLLSVRCLCSRGRHCSHGGGGPVAHRPRAALCRRRGGELAAGRQQPPICAARWAPTARHSSWHQSASAITALKPLHWCLPPLPPWLCAGQVHVWSDGHRRHHLPLLERHRHTPLPPGLQQGGTCYPSLSHCQRALCRCSCLYACCRRPTAPALLCLLNLLLNNLINHRSPAYLFRPLPRRCWLPMPPRLPPRPPPPPCWRCRWPATCSSSPAPAPWAWQLPPQCWWGPRRGRAAGCSSAAATSWRWALGLLGWGVAGACGCLYCWLCSQPALCLKPCRLL